MILDSVISEIAIHILLPIAPLNINKAISDVATISKLFSSEAFAAVVMLSPIIKQTGAAISNITILMIYGISFFDILASIGSLKC